MFDKFEKLIGALALFKFCSVTSLGGLLVSIQHKMTEDELGVFHWEHACSGVLLSVDQVLTCSSCVVFDKDGSFEILEQNLLRVYSGDNDPDLAEDDPNGQIVGVSNVQNHPEYRPARVVEPVYDFGIVKTEKPLILGQRLHVTELFSTDFTIVKRRLKTVGSKCKTMTWDFYRDGERQKSALRGVWIEVVFYRISECDSVRNDGTARMNQTFVMEEEGEDDFLMCAVSPLGHPICGMDLGSPIICEEKILAIVSNIGLLCDRGLQQVVISGINNAIAFITEPALLEDAKLKTLDHPRSHKPHNASPRTTVFPFIIFLEPLIKYIILYF